MMRSIIDWLALLCIIDCLGFASLLILVGLLFRQHDQSVLSELKALRRDVTASKHVERSSRC